MAPKMYCRFKICQNWLLKIAPINMEMGVFARVSEGGGYTLRLHAEDGGTLTREATVTY